MRELLQMYREYSDKRFDTIDEELQEIRVVLQEIKEFKIQSINGAKVVSTIVSAVSGVVTLIITWVLTHKK